MRRFEHGTSARRHRPERPGKKTPERWPCCSPMPAAESLSHRRSVLCGERPRETTLSRASRRQRPATEMRGARTASDRAVGAATPRHHVHRARCDDAMAWREGGAAAAWAVNRAGAFSHEPRCSAAARERSKNAVARMTDARLHERRRRGSATSPRTRRRPSSGAARRRPALRGGRSARVGTAAIVHATCRAIASRPGAGRRRGRDAGRPRACKARPRPASDAERSDADKQAAPAADAAAGRGRRPRRLRRCAESSRGLRLESLRVEERRARRNAPYVASKGGVRRRTLRAGGDREGQQYRMDARGARRADRGRRLADFASATRRSARRRQRPWREASRCDGDEGSQRRVRRAALSRRAPGYAKRISSRTRAAVAGAGRRPRSRGRGVGAAARVAGQGRRRGVPGCARRRARRARDRASQRDQRCTPCASCASARPMPLGAVPRAAPTPRGAHRRRARGWRRTREHHPRPWRRFDFATAAARPARDKFFEVHRLAGRARRRRRRIAGLPSIRRRRPVAAAFPRRGGGDDARHAHAQAIARSRRSCMRRRRRQQRRRAASLYLRRSPSLRHLAPRRTVHRRVQPNRRTAPPVQHEDRAAWPRSVFESSQPLVAADSPPRAGAMADAMKAKRGCGVLRDASASRASPRRA